MYIRGVPTIRHRIGDRVFTIPDSPLLIEHLERARDDTFQLGWTMLRICKLADGTFGIDERRGDAWIASADHALADLAAQLQTAKHLGVVDQLDYPVQDQAVMAADCALTAKTVLLTRISGDDLPATFSGWTILCTDKHDHGERHFVPLFAVAAQFPAIVPYLALPRGSALLLGLGLPCVFVDGELRAPRSYPGHDYLGNFATGDRVAIRDTRNDPPIAIELACVPGRWHAWLRTGRDAPAALMAVQEAHLDRANDEPLAFGGDGTAGVAQFIRAEHLLPTSDWRALERRLRPDTWQLVALACRNEPAFASRWDGGPVPVMIHDPAHGPAPGALEGPAGMLDAGSGCWARATTEDNWSLYGVEHGDRVVLLRVCLTAHDDHKFLIDRKSSGRRLDAPVTAAGARTYSRLERYAVGDRVIHPSFGLGRVTGVDGKRVEIAFEVGVKTLAHTPS